MFHDRIDHIIAAFSYPMVSYNSNRIIIPAETFQQLMPEIHFADISVLGRKKFHRFAARAARRLFVTLRHIGVIRDKFIPVSHHFIFVYEADLILEFLSAFYPETAVALSIVRNLLDGVIHHRDQFFIRR